MRKWTVMTMQLSYVIIVICKNLVYDNGLCVVGVARTSNDQ